MNEQFHPLTLGEILDRTAQIYRARFAGFMGISAIPTVILIAFLALGVSLTAFVTSLLGSSPLTHAQGITFATIAVTLGIVALPVCLGAMALSWAALTDAAAKTFQGGTFTIRGVYGNAWKRRWRLLWLMAMDVLFVGAIPASIGIVLFAVPGLAAGPAVGIAIFLLLAALSGAVLWLLLWMSLGFAACVMEQVSAWQALRRSGVLSTGTRSRIFVLFLLGYALEVGLSIVIFFVAAIAIALLPGLQGAKNANAVSTALVFGFYGLSFVVQALVRPVYGIGLTLFYFDQRIRKEGFDIEWMMQHAGMASELTVEEPAGGAES